MPVLFVHHRTHYHYPNWVKCAANQIKLYPFSDAHQHLVDHRIVVSSSPEIFTIQDYFENKTGFFSVLKPHRELSIESFLRVEMSSKTLKERYSTSDVWKELLSATAKENHHNYLNAELTKHQNEIAKVLRLNSEEHPLEELLRLSEYIYQNFEYKKGVTTIETGIDELWKLKAGVCQDFAHLLLYMMRLCGVPCRYVSGYICPGTSEWRGEGATHAWVEAWLPDLGWIGIDPTNKCLAGERHIRLAVGRNFVDCTPVKGTYVGSSEHLLEVTVQFSTTDFSADQLKPKEITSSEREHFKQRISESYDAYVQRQQQQQ